MSDAPARSTESREFARIDVGFRVRVQPLDAERAALLGQRLTGRPSVWTPADEASLRELAHRGAGSEAVLAGSLLELAGQVSRLTARLRDDGRPVRAGTLRQLSGGGGLLHCDLALDIDDRFELEIVEEDAPPIVALGHVANMPRPGVYGFRFEAIHPRDHDTLIRLIYQLQRRALREANRDSPD